MKSHSRNGWKLHFCFFIFWMCAITQSAAQEKVTVQIKTFTQQLEPYRNLEVSINNGPFIAVGNRGSIVAELASTDFPIKSVTIKKKNSKQHHGSSQKVLLRSLSDEKIIRC